MQIKIRPAVMLISTGLVVALVYAVAQGDKDLVALLSVALMGALTKLVESEEATGK
ncbi:hypothetical protein LCGC14_2121590 [marine sediment metagenome]|uniref:Uncharacterized protein n=1 Tax=marine sediment metagenome TaxID=412755 RepID=A0A0F9ERA9_9ZZZZ